MTKAANLSKPGTNLLPRSNIEVEKTECIEWY